MSRENGRRELAALVQLSYPQTNDPAAYPETHGKYVNLRIEDDESGLVLVDLDLSAAQWLQILSTAATRATMQVPTGLDRIGKRREVATDKIGYVSKEDAERLRQQFIAGGDWDYVTVVSRQGGYWIERVRWVDPKEEV